MTMNYNMPTPISLRQNEPDMSVVTLVTEESTNISNDREQQSPIGGGSKTFSILGKSKH